MPQWVDDADTVATVLADLGCDDMDEYINVLKALNSNHESVLLESEEFRIYSDTGWEYRQIEWEDYPHHNIEPYTLSRLIGFDIEVAQQLINLRNKIPGVLTALIKASDNEDNAIEYYSARQEVEREFQFQGSTCYVVKEE